MIGASASALVDASALCASFMATLLGKLMKHVQGGNTSRSNGMSTNCVRQLVFIY